MIEEEEITVVVSADYLADLTQDPTTPFEPVESVETTPFERAPIHPEQIQILITKRDALIVRRDELLALVVARISQEMPLPSEPKGWDTQRATIIAEVEALRAALAEAARKTAIDEQAIGALHVAVASLTADLTRARDQFRLIAHAARISGVEWAWAATQLAERLADRIERAADS